MPRSSYTIILGTSEITASPPAHVAIQRAVSRGRFTLVARRQQHVPELVGRRMRMLPRSRAWIFSSASPSFVPAKSGPAFPPSPDAALDGHCFKPDPQVLRQRRRIRFGMIRRIPRRQADAHDIFRPQRLRRHAATTAESIPPESPNTTLLNPHLRT